VGGPAANYRDVMDRDLWLTSGRNTLGTVLASQADMDDVLRAATEAPRLNRKARKAERRQRKASTAVQWETPAAVDLVGVVSEAWRQG